MYKKLNLNENNEVQINLIEGVRLSNKDNTTEKVYKSLAFTDGIIENLEQIVVDMNFGDYQNLSKGEINRIREIAVNYPQIQDFNISKVLIKNPTYVIILTMAMTKHGKKERGTYSLNDISALAVKPMSFETRINIRKTYEDIREMILDKDMSMFELFLEKGHVFRLAYEEQESNIYQLKNRNIK